MSEKMHRAKCEILVDADACPKVIKEILYRAAKRLSIKATFYANHGLTLPASPFLKFVQVPGGFDVVDKRIVDEVNPNSLVITADIPLAFAVIQKGAFALNPRGQFYTKENIEQRLALRNFMDEMRSSGQMTGGGPAPLNNRDQQAFANALDSFLAKSLK
ncbi:MAG: YaiI/YqxD family protein [Proteobacteria bacterium]|nr:YaiI/YqxD family protein [Pseudomonadota bacterium]